MTATVDFYFDFMSPYSYLACSQLSSLEADIRVRPVDLQRLMQKVGNVATTVSCKPKFAYAMADLGRWAQHYGIPLNPSNIYANDFKACSLAVLSATNEEQALAITTELFSHIWGKASTLESVEAVVAALEGLNVDHAAIASGAVSDAMEAEWTKHTDEAVDRGAFGAPTLFVGDQMFFGNDRFDFLRAALSADGKSA